MRILTHIFLIVALSVAAPAAPLITLDGLSNLEEPAHRVPLDSFMQLDLEIPVPPSIVPTTGSKFLCYELLATNMVPEDYRLTQLEILDTEEEKVIYRLQGRKLRAATRLSGGGKTKPKKDGPLLIPGGQRAIIFLFYGFQDNQDIPRKLGHRLTFRTSEGERVFDYEKVLEVNDERLLVLGPPVLGGPWFCDGAPGPKSYHRRTVLSLNGVSRVSQRYAIDLELLTPDGKTFHGHRSDNNSYPCYGKQIYSMSDGKVVRKIDGLVDNKPPHVPKFEDPDQAGGNSLIIELEEGKKYLIYGHMQPGSITVKEGDHVSRGQPLGRIGNSGNSFEPHLHIQLCDRPSFLGAQGLPFIFQRYTIIQDKDESRRINELPMLNQVIKFPDKL